MDLGSDDDYEGGKAVSVPHARSIRVDSLTANLSPGGTKTFDLNLSAHGGGFGDDLDRSSQLVFARFLDHGRTSSCPQRNHSTHSTIYAKSEKMDLYSIFNCTVFPALGRVGSRDI